MKKIRLMIITLGLAILLVSSVSPAPAAAGGATSQKVAARRCFEILGIEICY